jgi:excisionase family DNA binding protein
MTEQPRNGSVSITFGHPDETRMWVRCANIVAARILDGTYPAGEWMPPLEWIGAEFGMGSRRVREAFAELCAKGLVTHVRNRGYYAGNGSPPKGPKTAVRPRQQRPTRTPDDGPERQAGGNYSILLTQSYLTIREIAVMVRLGEVTVYRMVKNGHFEGAIKIGRSYRIPESSVEGYLKGRTIERQQIAAGTADAG